MSRPRYLTKSRFRLATECPTKLFYTGKQDIYPDKAIENTFLAALAEGGFQVGELAKAYFPTGHTIQTLDYETALAETSVLLEQENVIIFEAAVRYENQFIRIDVLRKQGKVFDLIEVKAKSFDAESAFRGKKSGKISNGWRPYLIDVAYQDYVLRNALPGALVRPSLMLADKNSSTNIDGLNQKFKIKHNELGRAFCKTVGDVSGEGLGAPILVNINVEEYVRELQGDTYEVNDQLFSFENYVRFLSEKYDEDERIPPKIECSVCSRCQFRATAEEETDKKISGYKECWKTALGFSEVDLKAPSVLDIWSFRKKQEFLESQRFFMRDIKREDFNTEKPMQARQWLQVQKTVAKDPTPWIDVEGLREAFSTWTWPLHLIDFETSAVAIPFTANRRPYEVTAFQFSHHIITEDWQVEHVDEYLNAEIGEFPNFEFVRRLKASLQNDEGSIFCYAPHENTVLNQIKVQLEDAAEEVSDGSELIEWIKTITHDSKMNWEGHRNMVDLLELVKNHYFQLNMGGSNSIKKVLPAILNSSAFLQHKYGQPVYNGFNFKNKVWVERDESGRVIDPYKLLPNVFSDISQEELDQIPSNSSLSDGGAAMTAYARVQFSDVSGSELQSIRGALLRYCELDTLAMVMILEAWNADISAPQNEP